MSSAIANQAQDPQNDYKDTLQEFFRVGNLTLIPLWLAKLRQGGKIEDLRKAIEFMSTATAAMMEKKADPNANLPVFNFIFTNGGVQATQMQVVEEVQVANTATSLPATELVQDLDIQFMKPPEVTAADLAALRAELDDMLAEIG